jgi:hypothetical protein
MSVRVHIFMRPDSAFCLVATDGQITSDSTLDHSYVGMEENRGMLAATSVAKYWDETLKDNTYAQHTIVEWKVE